MAALALDRRRSLISAATAEDLPRLFHTVELQFIIHSSHVLLRLQCFVFLLRSRCINIRPCFGEVRLKTFFSDKGSRVSAGFFSRGVRCILLVQRELHRSSLKWVPMEAGRLCHVRPVAVGGVTLN